MVVSTDLYKRHIEYPDANRNIVRDRTDHCDSQIYDEASLDERIVKPLKEKGVRLVTPFDSSWVEIGDPFYYAVRELYTFARLVFVKDA